MLFLTGTTPEPNEVEDLKELSNGLYLYMDMTALMNQMGLKPCKGKHLRVLRINEPIRYQSRCHKCEQGTFDVFYSPTNLTIQDIQCASAVCACDAFLDLPSGSVRSTEQLVIQQLEIKSRCTEQSNPTGTTQKKKRGRPLGSKNKNGTKKSRMLMAQMQKENASNLDHLAQLAFHQIG